MKIYTKTGDNGTTALFGGTRVKKHHLRIETYGTIDELNSWLGLLRDQEIDIHFKEKLIEVQSNLFTPWCHFSYRSRKIPFKKWKGTVANSQN